jgi:hypothetical protein
METIRIHGHAVTGLGQAAQAPGHSTAALVGVAIGAAVVGGLLGAALAAPPAARAGSSRGPGYYVLLYNYPRGHRDRRLKGFNGPFGTRAEAERDADSQKDVWYPAVRKLADDPFTLGM